MMRLAVSFSAAVLTALSLPAIAKVSQQEADRLGKELTPLGAERAANAKGTIPEWTGGLLEGPSNYKGREVNDLLRDPYPNDKPLYTITAQNVEQYKHLLRDPGGRSGRLNGRPKRAEAGQQEHGTPTDGVIGVIDVENAGQDHPDGFRQQAQREAKVGEQDQGQ